MAFVIADRVRETTTTTGTGSVTLAGAYTSFQTFSAAIGNANNTYYTIASAVNGEWEVGIGTYSSGGNLLSRDTVLSSSNAGSLVNFSVGTKDVFVTQPSKRSLLLQSGGTGLFAGAAAFTSGGVVYANATTTATTSSNLTFDGTTLTANALTTTSTVTINGGTANGVAYLNGSKVLTTGSALVFDGSNLGLGVTPSAWSNYKAFQFGYTGALSNHVNLNYLRLESNSFNGSGGETYLQNGYATKYAQNNGAGIHAWYTAPSGTAGNAITFTQAMTLAASGGLSIGTTSDAGTKNILLDAGGKLAGNAPSGGTSSTIELYNASTGNMNLTTGFSSAAITFATNSTERARITSGGDLLVGTTTNASGSPKVAVNGSIQPLWGQYRVATVFDNSYRQGLYFDSTNRNMWLFSTTNDTGGNIIFSTRVGAGSSDADYGTERARITSGGNFLVGTDNAAENAGSGMKVLNTGGTVALVSTVSDSSQQGFEMYSTGAAAYRLYINYAGTIHATNTTISAISDQRLKENIQDLDVGLNAVMALKPRKFDWKAGKGKDIKGDRGWIAQEFEQVFPDLVDEWKDPVPEGEEPYKSVRADLIPVLVKAIQELKAEVDSLKAQLKGA